MSNDTMKKALKYTALAGAISILSACQSTNVEETVAEVFSGYLSDYSILEQTESNDDSDLKVWINDKVDKTKYKKLMFEPAIFYPELPVVDQASPEVLKQVKDYFNKQVQSAVGDDFGITDQPGPDTLKVEMAITAIVIDDKPLSALEYLPIGFIASAASGNLNNMSVKMQVESKGTDSVTGELIAASVKRGEGEKLKNDESELALENLSPLIDDWTNTFRESMISLLKENKSPYQ